MKGNSQPIAEAAAELLVLQMETQHGRWNAIEPVASMGEGRGEGQDTGASGGGNGDRILWHNAIRDVIFCAAQSAALSPSKEVPNLISDSLSRPADVFLPTWSCGCPVALDVYVISLLQQQTIAEAAFTPGHALQVGVQQKLASHLSACHSAGIDLIPIAAEALGGLVEDTITIVYRLGDFISQHVGQVSSGSTPCKLFHQLAIALWRGNACLWLYRQPTLPPSVDGFV